MSRLSVDGFKNFFRYWNNGIKQNEAIEALYAVIPVSLLEEDATWIDLYRTPDPVPESVLPAAAVQLICEFEGFRPTVYNDGVGVATIGYGSTFYLDGRSVTWNDGPITEPQARKMMEQIAEKDGTFSKSRSPLGEMSDGQRGALLSFDNLGAYFYGSPGFNTISACLTDRLGMRSQQRSGSTSIPVVPWKPDCDGAEKPKSSFGIRSRLGRTLNRSDNAV